MSSGVLINIPALDRAMVPFIPFDNDNLLDTLQKRIDQAKGLVIPAVEESEKWFMVKSGRSPNVNAITKVASEFLNFLEKNDLDNINYHTNALILAGEIVHMIKKPPPVTMDTFIDVLSALKEKLQGDHPVDLKDSGIDQIVARLNFLALFEEEVYVHSYYALWIEDVEVPKKDTPIINQYEW